MVTRGRAVRENDKENMKTGQQRSSGDGKKDRYLSEQEKADSENPMGITYAH